MKIIYIFLLSVLVLSCEKDEVTQEQSKISESDVIGSWRVSYLEHGDVSDLIGYEFSFNADNELVITKDDFVTIGSWELINNSNQIKILIPEKEYPLRTLHSEWGVKSSTGQEIKLLEMNSDNDFLEKSHFTRL